MYIISVFFRARTDSIKAVNQKSEWFLFQHFPLGCYSNLAIDIPVIYTYADEATHTCLLHYFLLP